MLSIASTAAAAAFIGSRSMRVDNRSDTLPRSVQLAIGAEIRRATARDMPALATWSGHVETVFKPSLERSDRMLLIAHANGRFPIGHVFVDLSGGVISHLLVLAGFRDQGLGTALVAEAEQWLRENGAHRAAVLVEKSNSGAIRLYERLSYTKTGEAVETWPEPTEDGSLLPVDHPVWVMQNKL